jgi:GT2 family glycosyltransferase
LVDIVVVSFNTRQLLERCLRSIRAHTPPGAYRLHVVDNASSDGSAEWARAQPDVDLVVSAENAGYARACNQGARRGDGEHILFLNADVAALPGWLPPLLDTLESDERIAVVGPRLVNEQGRIVGAGIVGTNAEPEIRLWMQREIDAEDRRCIDCLSVCGAAYMIKRALVPVLGLFDERYFFYFEETDYSYNARDRGYRVVYCPASRMIHTWGGSGRANPLLGHYFSEGRRLFDRKWAHMMSDPRVYG